MIEKISDHDTWQTLRSCKKPIILYGMGNGADQIIAVLESLGLAFSDVFASDGFVRGQLFHGKKVLTLSEIEEKYDDFIIVMTFAVHDEKNALVCAHAFKKAYTSLPHRSRQRLGTYHKKVR